MGFVDDEDPPPPCEPSCRNVTALREDNAHLWQHIRAAEQAAGVARELVIEQFKEVERVLALLQQENALRKGILDAASQISIIYADLDGTVRLFNRGAEHLLGYDANEVVGAVSVARFHLPEELDAAGGLTGLARAAHRGGLQNREWTYLTRDGAHVQVMLSVSAVLDQIDNVAGLMFAATDMSEAKAAELALRRKTEEQAALLRQLQETQQQLLQSEKMASLGQLAAGVAHEINNPVGFVSSNLCTLGDYARHLLDVITAYETFTTRVDASPTARAVIEQARREADLEYIRSDVLSLIDESRDGLRRVAKIVQDLKTFSHMGETDWGWSDVHGGLESTLNVVWNELKYKATVEKRYGTLPQIYCVMSQLNQVFMNLLVNAAQAMEQPGTITITTAQEDGHVVVSVADTGKGIAPAHMKKLFDPFFTTKPVGMGTGLGLYIAFNIVRKHEGDIRVDSEPGRGTTFVVRLPIRPGAEEASSGRQLSHPVQTPAPE